jgi:hypothetical protein
MPQNLKENLVNPKIMSKYNLTDMLGESFDSLVKKLDKQKGIDKEEAGKIAGSIAAKKMAGAGKGPTAKQKARMNEYDRSFYRNNINPEGERTVYRFVQNLAKKYGYGEQEAAYLIKQVLTNKGLDEASDYARRRAAERDYQPAKKDKPAKAYKEPSNDYFARRKKELDYKYGSAGQEMYEGDLENHYRIDGLVNVNFKADFLNAFMKLYADLTEEDPFEAEEVLKYLNGEMKMILREKGMYENTFNPKSPSTNESETEDNVVNVDSVASPSAKGVGYDEEEKANDDEDDEERKNNDPSPMYEDLRKHFKRFL